MEREIKDYISNLSKEEEIHILTGELENFYKKIPEFTKKADVIEIISRRMEENKTIDEYVKIDEFIDALKIFIKNCLILELIENGT
ncbi:MAG: hypothetical protein Q7U60_11310 [Candidatus Methanoperedens sp.]|nr:hypothetical protein [Candidatus Methanoperedens sp.]